MSTQDFFQELKRERELRNISLAEISDATLINQKMLESIEQGKIDVVPQAYVRAFIREYAGVVGLDKDETLKKYDAWLQQRESVKHSAATPAELPAPELAATANQTWRDKLQRMMPAIMRTAAAVAILVLVDVILWSVLDKEDPGPVRERSFLEAAKEYEKAAGTPDSNALRARQPVPFSRATPAPMDSLTLTGTTTDSVWMQIVIDDTLQREHLLYPNTRLTWKARESFVLIAVGNPTAVTFTLNDRRLSLPYRRGFVTRNIRITRDSLRTQ